jgi:inorganic pyrophosphatase/exopolyphosphatase
MWVEKFKSPTVTRTNCVGRIVTRTKRGWTKRQGTTVAELAFILVATFLSDTSASL